MLVLRASHFSGFFSANTAPAPCITKGMGKCPENVAGAVNLACYSAIHALSTDEHWKPVREYSAYRAINGDLFYLTVSRRSPPTGADSSVMKPAEVCDQGERGLRVQGL
jgi:hypothetical protein